MTRLSDTEASRLDTALTRLYAVVRFDEFPGRALEVAQHLIGSNSCSYNQIDLKRGAHRVLIDQEELARPELLEPFARFIDQHPVISHFAATGDPASHLITDFITATEFRRLELYNQFFRPLGTEEQLSNALTTKRATHVIGLAFNRGTEGFSDRDRLLLDRLRPHLLVSFENSLLLSESLGRAGTGDGALGTPGVDSLTDRQLDVLRLVAEGQTNAQIAFQLEISMATVKKHLENILERLEVSTRTAAAARYLATGRPTIRAWKATVEV